MSAPLIPPDFERVITLGLSRTSAAVLNEEQALATLSLLAQRKRHRRLHAAAESANVGAHLHDDPRRLMPEAARKPLTRLGAALPKDSWSYLGPAIFERLAKNKVRLHPFDFPRLEPLLNACPENLGQAERAWLQLRAAPQTAESAGTAITSEAEWLLLPKPQKVAVIRQLRANDAATAREWIERTLASSPADVRTVLIAALEVDLDSDDAPLLEQVAKEDRAASVRDVAMNLLAATRGSEAYKAKLSAAVAFIDKGRTLFGRRTVKANAGALEKLSAGLTGTTTGARAAALNLALQREFQSLYFSDIASALSFTPEDLASALPAEDALTGPLTIAAIIEGDAKVLGKMTAHLSRFDLVDLISHFGSTLARLPDHARQSLLQVATQSVKLNWRSAHDLYWLGRLSGGVVSDGLARKLMQGEPWKTGSDATGLAVFASLLPKGRDADFAASIADLPRKDTAAAYEYLAFTTALEETPR